MIAVRKGVIMDPKLNEFGFEFRFAADLTQLVVLGFVVESNKKGCCIGSEAR